MFSETNSEQHLSLSPHCFEAAPAVVQTPWTQFTSFIHPIRSADVPSGWQGEQRINTVLRFWTSAETRNWFIIILPVWFTVFLFCIIWLRENVSIFYSHSLFVLCYVRFLLEWFPSGLIRSLFPLALFWCWSSEHTNRRKLYIKRSLVGCRTQCQCDGRTHPRGETDDGAAAAVTVDASTSSLECHWVTELLQDASRLLQMIT